MRNQYIVANQLQVGPNGMYGCSAFIVEATKSQSKPKTPYTLTGWHNTQERVTSPSEDEAAKNNKKEKDTGKPNK